MSFRDYYKFVEEQEVTGYTRGYTIDDFKKGEKVYVFHRFMPLEDPVLIEGTVCKILKAKNLKGEDKVRQITLDIGDNVQRNVTGVLQIKKHLFKKDEAAEVEPVIEPVAEVAADAETMIIEKAMTAKNKEVRKHIQMGWTFQGSEWSREKNMYIATLVKS